MVVPVECWPDEAPLTLGHTINVSSSGARLLLRGEAPETMSLTLGEDLEVRARRVWSQSIGKCQVAGVQFEDVSLGQRARLESFLGITF